jgi:hypothetical protein
MDRARTLYAGRRFAALGLLAILGACATLSERAETLYLRQNRAAAALAELIVATEPINPALADALYAAEAEFDDACAPLRRVGYQRLLGQDVGRDLEWAVVISLSACTAKSDVVERLVWRVSPHTAAFFQLPVAAVAPAAGAESGGVPPLSLTPQ